MNSQRLSHAIFTAIFVLLLGVINGCSIKQTVKPVELTGQPMEICIVKNEKVRPSFLEAYSDALKAKSVQVRTLDETTISERMYFYLHLRSPLGMGFSHVHEVCRN